MIQRTNSWLLILINFPQGYKEGNFQGILVLLLFI